MTSSCRRLGYSNNPKNQLNCQQLKSQFQASGNQKNFPGRGGVAIEKQKNQDRE